MNAKCGMRKHNKSPHEKKKKRGMINFYLLFRMNSMAERIAIPIGIAKAGNSGIAVVFTPVYVVSDVLPSSSYPYA